MPHRPGVKAFFDEPTNTASYVVWDPATKAAAVIELGARLRRRGRAHLFPGGR